VITCKHAFIILILMTTFGCSNGSNTSIVLDSTGKHPAGWAVALIGGVHPSAYQAHQSACIECHGSVQDKNSNGGTSGVSCFSASRNGIACHPNGPSSHPTGWSAAGSHGSAAKAAAPGLSYCTQCHGTNYTGGAGKSCMTCHTSAPHPAAPWRGTTASATTHTTTNQVNVAECARCHLNNQRLLVPLSVPAGATPGCFNNTLCHGVKSGHPAGWSAASSHGSAAKAAPGTSQGFAYCTQCHGADFVSGIGLSCRTCHTTAPHPIAPNWRANGAITHTTTDTNNASACSTCHNATTPNLAAPNFARFANSPAGSFKGGTPDCFSASLCHGDVRKTTNCDACHSTAATNPFKSMAGATATSDAKVGAHVKHLNASTQTPAYSSNISCSECHAVPGAPAISGSHRNGTNNIAFGTLAKTGSLAPTYTPATGVCANTYCHGTTLTGGGSNKSPLWNQSNYLAAGCATCHGYPPTTVRNGAAAHSTSSSCSGCHSHVNATNNGFSDPSKHINGTVEASGGASHAFPNPGSAHRSATPSSCSGCHNISSTTGSYPVASGTAPNCAGCHKLSLFAGCSDCHGDAATGRPNGSSFPNYNGKHSTHSGIACSVCHSGGGTGTSTHGNSGGSLKTANNVVVVFSTAGGTMTATRSYNSATNRLSVTCTGNCHEQHNGRSW